MKLGNEAKAGMKTPGIKEMPVMWTVKKVRLKVSKAKGVGLPKRFGEHTSPCVLHAICRVIGPIRPVGFLYCFGPIPSMAQYSSLLEWECLLYAIIYLTCF